MDPILVQLVQLAATISGLGVLAFHAGQLSQRVKHIEKEVFSDTAQKNRADDHDRLVKVEMNTTAIHDDVHQMKASMIGIQRQLSDLMMGKTGAYEIHARVEEQS